MTNTGTNKSVVRTTVSEHTGVCVYILFIYLQITTYMCVHECMCTFM